jgi:hypothetical protein
MQRHGYGILCAKLSGKFCNGADVKVLLGSPSHDTSLALNGFLKMANSVEGLSVGFTNITSALYSCRTR